MINFWGIQRSFLIIRSVSSGWKYDFSGRRGAVNGQHSLLWMQSDRAHASLWSKPGSLSVALSSAGKWWAPAKSALPASGMSARGCHCTRVPRLWEVIREITWLNPSCLWCYLSFTASSGNSRKFQFLLRLCALCQSLCRGCEGREGFTSTCTDRLTCLFCLWRVTSWNQYADQECSEYLKKILWLWFLHHPSSLLKK